MAMGGTEAQKRKIDDVYEERNRLVALLATMSADRGWLVFRTKTAIHGWSEDWHGCIYIETPRGQVSWHYHDSHAHLFAHVQERASWGWDGHSTQTKYERIAALAADVKSDLCTGGFTPGQYYITCIECGSTTQDADKRACRCPSCARMVMRIAVLEAALREGASRPARD